MRDGGPARHAHWQGECQGARPTRPTDRLQAARGPPEVSRREVSGWGAVPRCHRATPAGVAAGGPGSRAHMRRVACWGMTAQAVQCDTDRQERPDAERWLTSATCGRSDAGRAPRPRARARAAVRTAECRARPSASGPPSAATGAPGGAERRCAACTALRAVSRLYSCRVMWSWRLECAEMREWRMLHPRSIPDLSFSAACRGAPGPRVQGPPPRGRRARGQGGPVYRLTTCNDPTRRPTPSRLARESGPDPDARGPRAPPHAPPRPAVSDRSALAPGAGPFWFFYCRYPFYPHARSTRTRQNVVCTRPRRR